MWVMYQYKKMRAKVTLEEWIKRLEGRNIEILKFGGNVNVKSTFKCELDGHIWETSLSSIFRGRGCAKCSNRLKVTLEEWIKRLEGRNIEILKFGGNVNVKSIFKCELDDYIWEARLSDIFRGGGCPKCAINNNINGMLPELNYTKFNPRKILRNRFRQLYKTKKIKTKVWEEGWFQTLDEHWLKECKLIPPKPSNYHHLDHILPINLFDPNDLQDQIWIWTHRNFQWLEASENMSKGTNIIEEYLDPWHCAVMLLKEQKEIDKNKLTLENVKMRA